MATYKAKATISKGGSLHLTELPFKDGQPVEVAVEMDSSAATTWPADFFAETFGSIKDESFARHPQGAYEARAH